MARYNAPETIEWDHETDVLVIGFGGAGGCAAIEAFDAGADVAVIEKQGEQNYISNTRMSNGSFHSPKPSGDPDALEEYSLAMFSGHNIPGKLEGELPTDIAENLAARWAEYAPENRAWMKNLDPDLRFVEFDLSDGAAFSEFPGADECGYRVLQCTYSGEITNKNERQMNYPKEKKELGEAFYACLKHGVEQREIDVHWDTPAEELILDEDGDVLGVIAERNGEEKRYRADSTILTTGGFEYNKDLRLNFLEGPGVEGWAFYGSPYNTGDGIVMSMEVNAALSKVGKSAARVITAIPKRENELKIGLKTPVIGRPNAIVVNNFGERYANERTITEDPTRYMFYKEAVKFDIERLIYPRIPSWLIFDETLRKRRPLIPLRMAEYHDIEWGKDNAAAIESGWVLKAETIEGLTREIRTHPDNRDRMDPDTLSRTVQRYNRYCEKGRDEEFGSAPENMAPIRSPPYYALPLYPGGPNTKGGILATADREVVDWSNDPVSNLYTAGEISSAFKFVYQGGGNLAECIVFGRIAGENAAKNSLS